MIYRGYFCDNDDVQYKVDLEVGNVSGVKTITLGGTPCVISQVSDGLFTPIKSRSCTITYVAKSLIEDLYTPDPFGVKVTVTKTNNNTIMFNGYLTPCSYNQPYAHYIDEVELFAVDAISCLKEKKYSTISQYADIYTIGAIIKHCLMTVGLNGDFYYPSTMMADGDSNIMDILYLQEANFFDSDREHTPWSCYEVLEEICKYFGWSLVLDGDNVHLIDYRRIITSGLNSEYLYHNGSQQISPTNADITISAQDYVSNDSNVSYENIYNKFSVSQSAYDIEDIFTDVNEEENLISISKEKGLGAGNAEYNIVKPRFLWLGYKNEESYRLYSTFYRFKPESGWTSHFYSQSSGSQVADYDDGSTNLSWDVNQAINTRTCLLERYASYETTRKKPTSLGWDNCLTFFMLNDTSPSTSPSAYYSQMRNKPALTYENNNIIRYSPAYSGDKLWILIKGDVWYQKYHKISGKKNNIILYNQNEGCYCVTPLDNCLPENAQPYNDGNGSFGGIFEAKLQIGDKYWDGGSWTTTESTFTIVYDNRPEKPEDEAFMYLEWMSPVTNTDFRDKVSEEGFAIPIAYDDDLVGPLKFDLYFPSLMPNYPSSAQSESWDKWPMCIFLKDFGIQTIFTTSDDFYVLGDNSKNDILFTHVIEQGYTSEYSDIELKINTNIKDNARKIHSRPSKSHVLLNDGYLVNISDGNRFGYAEENLLERYYDHYTKRNMILGTSVEGYRSPRGRFMVSTPGFENKKFIVDSYKYDLRNKSNYITLIEY